MFVSCDAVCPDFEKANAIHLVAFGRVGNKPLPELLAAERTSQVTKETNNLQNQFQK